MVHGKSVRQSRSAREMLHESVAFSRQSLTVLAVKNPQGSLMLLSG